MNADFTPSHSGGAGSPLVLLHGFTDTWRTWDLVLPELEKRHAVFAPTLPGHAGGPDLASPVQQERVLDQVEEMLDREGIETAHIAGNSLGGYLALKLAARGRARSVTALAPAGGWAVGDDSFKQTLEYFVGMKAQLERVEPQIDSLLSSPEGRRLATQFITTNYEHIPKELIAHQILGVIRCEGAADLIRAGLEEGWSLDAEKVTCPVRMVWGTGDRILAWPTTALRYRDDWLPNADWIELDGIGHCPQLDVPTEAAQLILGFSS